MKLVIHMLFFPLFSARNVLVTPNAVRGAAAFRARQKLFKKPSLFRSAVHCFDDSRRTGDQNARVPVADGPRIKTTNKQTALNGSFFGVHRSVLNSRLKHVPCRWFYLRIWKPNWTTSVMYTWHFEILAQSPNA